jgi:hypothetical protein
MTGVEPVVIFFHYYGTGPAARLAQGVRAAVDLLGTDGRHRAFTDREETPWSDT